MYVAGKSGNAAGRPKNRYSVNTVKGLAERFLKKQMTTRKLNELYEKLSAKDKADFLVSLAPYCTPMMTESGISKEEVEILYDKVQQALKDQQYGKAV